MEGVALLPLSCSEYVRKRGKSMNCREMMQIPELKNVLKLRTGEQGLSTQIRWIYFADCLQCVQSEYKIENYIHGGEFVILTNRAVTGDREKLLPLVTQFADHQISALGINEGQISEELLQYCEERNLPLFELPEKYPLIDLSQLMCQRLVIEENRQNAGEQLFASILDAEHLSREDVMDQARYLNINLDGEFCVAEFTYKKIQSSHMIGNVLMFGQKIREIIRNAFSYHTKEKILMLSQAGSILVLIPMATFQNTQIKSIVLRIIERVLTEYHAILYVGVGNSTGYLEDVKQSRNEAAAANKVARTMNKQKGAMSFYSDLGIYTLISHVDEPKVLDAYVEDQIGKLLQADEVNKGNLCETLENYLNQNCNAKKTAEEMFVHRNTLNYRLKKISEILDCDYEKLEDCVKLKLAFIILKYRNNKR